MEATPPLNEQAPGWCGQWARIWLQPSVFSAQRYIVGIAILDTDGLRGFRLITGTEKFACVYGEDGSAMVDQIIAQTRETLTIASNRHTPPDTLDLPPGVTLDPVGMAADRTPEHALEAAMVEAEIPMEPRPAQMCAPRTESRKAAGTMEATTTSYTAPELVLPEYAVFTYVPRAPEVTAAYPNHRLFLRRGQSETTQVVRYAHRNTAAVTLAESGDSSARINMSPDQLRTLARALLDAAADIERFPAEVAQ